MSAIANSRLDPETATLPVEVLEFLDVSACYLGMDEFPRALVDQSARQHINVQHLDIEVQMQ